MSRLLPDGFLEGYARLGGPSPAMRDFLEAYELLCDVLYHGTATREDVGRTTGGGDGEGYWFGDPTLLGFKGAVDRRLARLGSNLRHWAEARAGQAARRPGPPNHDRSDLARAAGAGHSGPVAD